MEAINQTVVTYLLNASWQITVIAGLGLAFDAFLRRMPFRYRHVVWVTCLGACVLVPLVTLVLQSYAGGGIGLGHNYGGFGQRRAIRKRAGRAFPVS